MQKKNTGWLLGITTEFQLTICMLSEMASYNDQTWWIRSIQMLTVKTLISTKSMQIQFAQLGPWTLFQVVPVYYIANIIWMKSTIL